MAWSFSHWHALFAICLLLLVSGCDRKEASSFPDSVAECDKLASHPHDPGRQTGGVLDESLGVGAAINACEAATKTSPDTPRLQFQLGRSYWLANRDADAFSAFVDAASHDYAPAMKYIGDAYLEGRGLPPGKQQDARVALHWYELAERGGFADGTKAIQETKRQILDPNLFQVPDYIRRINETDIEGLDSPVYFMHYLRSFVEELGSDKILYVDSKCKPLVSSIGGTALHVGQILTYLTSLKNKQGIVNAGISFLSARVAKDQGERDAVNLVNQYGCDSAVAKKLVGNVVISYGRMDQLIGTTSKGIVDMIAKRTTK